MSDKIPDDLKVARNEIDRIDAQLVRLLGERQNVVERVIDIKKRNNLPAYIPDRVDVVIENAARQASEVGLSPDLARRLWRTMVEWFVDYENEKLGK